jgi:hypothetical protein
MSYIGRGIYNLSDRAVLDSIITSATATYNLLLNTVAYVPSSAESLTVSLNGVIQAPQSSYTVSGSTIVFASSLADTDSIDFILAERAITLTTVGSGSVGTSQLVDGNVTTAKIADGAVTSAKLDSGVLPNNTPYFSATTTVGQTISSDTMTLVSYPTENFDPDGVFTNTASNYKFTVPSGKAGTYSLTAKIWVSANGAAQLQNYFVEIRKNGTAVATTGHNFNSNDNYWALPEINTLQVLAVGDYIQVFAQVSDSSGSPTIGYAGNGTYAEFSGFKLI